MRAPLDNRVIDGASIRQPKLPVAPQSQSPAVVSMLREKRCDSFLSVVSDDVDLAVAVPVDEVRIRVAHVVPVVRFAEDLVASKANRPAFRQDELGSAKRGSVL